jgi:hypothetical protein
MAVNKYAPTEEELDFMEYSVKEAPKEKTVPWYKSYPSAAAQAVLEGVISVGEMMGPTGTPMERQQARESRQKLYEEYLPTGDSYGPNAIKRGGKTAVESLAFPGAGLATAGRALLGGALAEGAKELGAPEIVQTGIEIGTQLTPNLSKKIPNKLPTQAAAKERQLMEEARRLGLTEEELALTLNQRGPAKDFLVDISAKGGRVKERFDNTRQALGRVWENLRGSPDAQKTLTGQQSSQLINGMSKKLANLPAEQRTRILQDYNDFLGSQMRGEDVIDFWQKMNYYINKGEGKLGTLKEDLQSALMQISPELGKDFKITNELYGNFHKLAERMGPNIAESLIHAGEQGIVVSAITSGNYPLLQKVLGPLAARQLATEMTTNPRMMNLSSRFINSLERGLPVVAKKVYEQMLIEVGKTNAEAAMKMSNLDLDNLFEALDQENQD